MTRTERIFDAAIRLRRRYPSDKDLTLILAEIASNLPGGLELLCEGCGDEITSTYVREDGELYHPACAEEVE